MAKTIKIVDVPDKYQRTTGVTATDRVWIHQEGKVRAEWIYVTEIETDLTPLDLASSTLVRPLTDGDVDLGDSSHEWNNVYAEKVTISVTPSAATDAATVGYCGSTFVKVGEAGNEVTAPSWGVWFNTSTYNNDCGFFFDSNNDGWVVLTDAAGVECSIRNTVGDMKHYVNGSLKMTVNSSGVTLGDALSGTSGSFSSTVSCSGLTSGNVVSNSSTNRDLGSSSNYWRNLYLSGDISCSGSYFINNGGLSENTPVYSFNGYTGAGVGFDNDTNPIVSLITQTSTRFYVGGPSNNCVSWADLVPYTGSTYDLGSSSQDWSNLWCDTANYYTATARSDESLKTDIKDIDLGLDFILSLRPVSFKWKECKDRLPDPENKGRFITTTRAGKRTHYGLIAQQVEKASGEKDFGGFERNAETGICSLRYNEITATLIKAVQELTSQVEALTQRVADLEGGR